MDKSGVIIKLHKIFKPFSHEKVTTLRSAWMEKALNLFHDLGFLNIVVTNQPDIARCLMSEQILNWMHNLIKLKLAVDDIFVCTHDDSDNCLCRKPKPGMILDASAKWGIDPASSFFIGDTWKDIHAGRAAGCATILIEYPYNKGLVSDYRVKSLLDVIDIIKT